MKRRNQKKALARQNSTVLYRARTACETLEDRRLLSIVWVNRGTTDNFTAAFAGNEAAARAVVDQAIADWNAIILNFNHAGGGNTYNLTLGAMELGGTLRANGGPDAHDGERVPLRGTINLDLNAGGSGWYVDPEPRDDSEFTEIDNAFSATSAAGAFAGNDLYRTVTHEIGHAVGMIRNTNYLLTDFLTDTGVDDPNTTDAGNLFSYNFGGGAIEATFTEADSGHLYEGPFIPSRPDLPTHPFDLMTSGRASANNQRKLVSDTTAVILQQVYGYTIALPSTVNNMLCNPNFTNDVLTVTGMPSNQVGSPADNFLIQGTTDPNVLHVTADGFVELVPLNQVGSIVVNGLGGSDTLRLEYTAGRFTTFNGGSGADILDLSFLTRNLSNLTGPTLFNGGANTDSMFLYDNNNASADPWSIDNTRLTRTGTGLQQYDSEVENVFLNTGTAANTVNIASSRSLTKLHLNSAGGTDIVNVGIGAAGGAQNVLGDIEVQNSPSFTTLNVNDSGNSLSRPNGAMGYTFGTSNTFAHVVGVAPGTIFYKIADVSAVNVTAGGGSDAFLVADTPRVINYHNTGGADVVRVGNSFNGTDTILQNVNVSSSSFVVPTVIVDNAAGAAHTNTTLGVSGGTMNVNGMTGGGIITCPSTSAVQLFGSNFNDIIALNNTINNGQVLVDAGGGSDVVNVVGARITTLTVRGGTDSANDFLELFDASMPTNVVGGTVYTDRIVRDTAVPLDVFYSGFSSVRWNQQNQQNVIVVRGISADISPSFQFSIVGNTVDDILEVHTQDTAGNPSILGNLSFNGGGGPDVIQVFAGPVAENFRFYDPFGGSAAAYLGSNGPRWVAINTDVENVQVFGGAANDTFAVEKYSQSGAVRLFGRGGDDICTIGNGDLSANLTSASFFQFDGQTGVNDTFVISNVATTTSWDYRFTTGSAISQRVSTGYSWTAGVIGVEKQIVNAGSTRDSFVLDSTAAGVHSEFNGFAGNDGLLLGLTGNTVNNILGRVVYNGGQDGGNMGVYDSADTSGDIVHLDASSLGAYAGDTLFGLGGSLTFTNVVNFGGFPAIFLGLGSGADVVYAQPHVNGRVTINANNPAASPGDTLNLATASLTSPSINGTPASGNLTSGNRQTLDWTGFEGSISTDNVAPAFAVANINVIGIPAGGGLLKQTVDVGFFENVGGLLSVNSVQFTNLTTSQVIPASNMTAQYNTFSNTASFSFPGFANGVLPDGNYTGRVFAGLTDFFGNPLPADATFSFFFLNGDANRDRAVNIADFAIVAARFNQSGFFSDGDFNYDGVTNIADFSILASKFNTTLPIARQPGWASDGDLASSRASTVTKLRLDAAFEARALFSRLQVAGLGEEELSLIG